MVRDGLPGGRWVAGAECPRKSKRRGQGKRKKFPGVVGWQGQSAQGDCQVACTHILRLAQEGSAATTITRDCSGSSCSGPYRISPIRAHEPIQHPQIPGGGAKDSKNRLVR